MNKEEILYQIKVYDDDYSDNVPDEWRTGNGKSRQTYDIEKHRYIIEYVSDNYDVHSEIQRLQQENKQLKEDKTKAIENIKTIKQHYEELKKAPFEDSVFINDMLRQSFILSIESYLDLFLEILGDKE